MEALGRVSPQALSAVSRSTAGFHTRISSAVLCTATTRAMPPAQSTFAVCCCLLVGSLLHLTRRRHCCWPVVCCVLCSMCSRLMPGQPPQQTPYSGCLQTMRSRRQMCLGSGQKCMPKTKRSSFGTSSAPINAPCRLVGRRRRLNVGAASCVDSRTAQAALAQWSVLHSS